MHRCPQQRHAPSGSVVSVRRLPAIKTSKSNPPKWEVSYGSEDHGWKVIGWIEQRTLGRGHTTFYFAVGIHPQTGKHYRLEGTTDFDERVNTIADFHIDPMTCRQHLFAEIPAYRVSQDARSTHR